MNQTKITFPTNSPINIEKLGGQNKRLYDWLSAGNTIHVMHPAKRELKIGYINSRISDLRNEHNIIIYDRFISVNDVDGNPVGVKEYSLIKFDKS